MDKCDDWGDGWNLMPCFEPTAGMKHKTNLTNHKYMNQMMNNEATITSIILTGLKIWSDEVTLIYTSVMWS